MLRRLLIALLICVSGPAGGAAQSIDVDHVFVFVSPGAPEARSLEEAGLMVMPDTSRHTGQGTASIIVMFDNAYLELIWIDDAADFQDVGLGMPERRADPAGSPFGIGLRRTDPAREIPFETEPYTSEWMGDADPIRMARWSGSVAEPLIFVVPDAMRWDLTYERVPALQPFTRHELELQRLTEVRLVGPGVAATGGALDALAELGVVQIAEGERHVVHLTFDDGARGDTLDLRPTLPVVLHY